MLCPWAMSFFQKLCPDSFLPVSCSFPESHLDPQCSLYNFLEGQPENSPWERKTIQYPSPLDSQAFIFMLPTTCETTASLNGPARVGDGHTMPARSPSVGGIPSRAIGIPGIMFAILRVRPIDHLDPNPYHPSSKVTNIPPDQISTPLLRNIWSVASYQFVFKPLTSSYDQDPTPL